MAYLTLTSHCSRNVHRSVGTKLVKSISESNKNKSFWHKLHDLICSLDPQDHTIRPFLRSIFHLTGAVALTALFGVLISPIALLLTTAMVFTTLTIGTWATLETLNVIQGEESAPDGFATVSYRFRFQTLKPVDWSMRNQIDGCFQWSNYAYYLSQWQGVVQQQLSNLTATTVRSGISSEGGIYGALKGGAFLNEVSLEPISVYQKDLKQTSTTRLLVDILKAQVGLDLVMIREKIFQNLMIYLIYLLGSLYHLWKRQSNLKQTKKKKICQRWDEGTNLLMIVCPFVWHG